MPAQHEIEPSGGAHGAQSHPAGQSDDFAHGAAAFWKALTSASSSSSTPASIQDPRVTVAFALGWQMAELYRQEDWRPDAPEEAGELPKDLPGLGAFSVRQRLCIGLDQVDGALERLATVMKAQLRQHPSTADAHKALAEDHDQDFHWEIYRLHVQLLSALTAADFKVGKAYGLGRALADTCQKPENLDSLRGALGADRIANLQAWIADLTSVLPPHAGHSVKSSLQRWVGWAAKPDSPGPEEELRTLRLLRRQGERWRAVLSGEKAATDLLESGDYVSAGFGLLRRFAALARRFAWPFLLLVLAVIGLFGGGIAWLVLSRSTTTHILAGVGGLMASAGLSWKGVGGSLGRATSKLERPLWEAELDAAITEAITLLPGAKRTKHFKAPPLPSEGPPEAEMPRRDRELQKP